MEAWTTVGTRDQVEPDAPLGVSIGEQKFGVYDVDGELHAIEDICPHAAGPIGGGQLRSVGTERDTLDHRAAHVVGARHVTGEAADQQHRSCRYDADDGPPVAPGLVVGSFRHYQSLPKRQVSAVRRSPRASR